MATERSRECMNRFPHVQLSTTAVPSQCRVAGVPSDQTPQNMSVDGSANCHSQSYWYDTSLVALGSGTAVASTNPVGFMFTDSYRIWSGAALGCMQVTPI